MRLIPKYQSPSGPIVEDDNNEHTTINYYTGEDLYNIGRGYDTYYLGSTLNDHVPNYAGTYYPGLPTKIIHKYHLDPTSPSLLTSEFGLPDVPIYGKYSSPLAKYDEELTQYFADTDKYSVGDPYERTKYILDKMKEEGGDEDGNSYFEEVDGVKVLSPAGWQRFSAEQPWGKGSQYHKDMTELGEKATEAFFDAVMLLNPAGAATGVLNLIGKAGKKVGQLGKYLYRGTKNLYTGKATAQSYKILGNIIKDTAIGSVGTELYNRAFNTNLDKSLGHNVANNIFKLFLNTPLGIVIPALNNGEYVNIPESWEEDVGVLFNPFYGLAGPMRATVNYQIGRYAENQMKNLKKLVSEYNGIVLELNLVQELLKPFEEGIRKYYLAKNGDDGILSRYGTFFDPDHLPDDFPNKLELLRLRDVVRGKLDRLDKIKKYIDKYEDTVKLVTKGIDVQKASDDDIKLYYLFSDNSYWSEAYREGRVSREKALEEARRLWKDTFGTDDIASVDGESWDMEKALGLVDNAKNYNGEVRVTSPGQTTRTDLRTKERTVVNNLGVGSIEKSPEFQEDFKLKRQRVFDLFTDDDGNILVKGEGSSEIDLVVPGDFDVVTTEDRLKIIEAKNGGDRRKWAANARQHGVPEEEIPTYKLPDPNYPHDSGNPRYIDLNVLRAGPDGMARGERAVEIFAQYFPEDYAKAKTILNMESQAAGKKVPLKINKTPEELYQAIDPEMKAYMDMFLSSKEKHANRAAALLIMGDDPGKLGKAMDMAYTSMMGGQRPHKLPIDESMFYDYETNKKILDLIGYKLPDAVARDPKRMLNFVNYWYYLRTCFVRGIKNQGYVSPKEFWKNIHTYGKNWRPTSDTTPRSRTQPGGGTNWFTLFNSDYVDMTSRGNKGKDVIAFVYQPKLDYSNAKTVEDMIRATLRQLGYYEYKLTSLERARIEKLADECKIWPKGSRKEVKTLGDLDKALTSAPADRCKKFMDGLKEMGIRGLTPEGTRAGYNVKVFVAADDEVPGDIINWGFPRDFNDIGTMEFPMPISKKPLYNKIERNLHSDFSENALRIVLQQGPKLKNKLEGTHYYYTDEYKRAKDLRDRRRADYDSSASQYEEKARKAKEEIERRMDELEDKIEKLKPKKKALVDKEDELSEKIVKEHSRIHNKNISTLFPSLRRAADYALPNEVSKTGRGNNFNLSYRMQRRNDPFRHALHIKDRNWLLLEKGIPIAAGAGLGGVGYGVYKLINWFKQEHDKQIEEWEKKHKLGGRLYPRLINNSIKNVKINEVS